MKTRISTLYFVLCSISLVAQQLPIDFSTNEDSFIGFGGSAFSFRTTPPSSTTNRGGEFYNDGSGLFQGFFIDVAQPMVIDNDSKVFTLRFYAFDSNNHSLLLKLENPSTPAPDVEVQTQFTAPSPSDWITLTFDFNNAVDSSDGSTPAEANGTYTRLTLFIDDGVNAAGTYIIDDISNGTTPPNPHAIDVEYTDLVWSDEFDGTNGAINTSKWHHQTQLPAGGNWFNGEQQHYTNRTDNSRIENGFLHITAKREIFTDQGETKQFTSARLNSKFAFTYGRVDVRAKLPFGDGTWPAIWMLGKNINEDGAYWDNQGFGTTSWPACGEIDIMEHGLYAVNEINVALHTPSSFGATDNADTQFLQDVANNFHVFSMNWSPDKIIFLVDDVPFYSYNPETKDANTWPFDDDQYILLNIAMGGISGAIDPSFTESDMVIDYVRVFQNNTLSSAEFEAQYFKIYPNPTTDVVRISNYDKLDGIEIYNMLGQMLKRLNTDLNEVDLSTFKKGIYVLKLIAGEKSQSKRIVVN